MLLVQNCIKGNITGREVCISLRLHGLQSCNYILKNRTVLSRGLSIT